MVVNIGCGTDQRGIGIDLHYETADILADLNGGIPVGEDCVDHVVAEHLLEHLENPAFMLREIRRILRPDGTATIEIPNAGWLPVRLYVTQDIQRFWEHKIPGRSGHWLARRLGEDDPDRTQHLTLWTKQLLKDHLDRAGFTYEFQTRTHFRKNIRVLATPDDPDAD